MASKLLKDPLAAASSFEEEVVQNQEEEEEEVTGGDETAGGKDDNVKPSQPKKNSVAAKPTLAAATTSAAPKTQAKGKRPLEAEKAVVEETESKRKKKKKVEGEDAAAEDVSVSEDDFRPLEAEKVLAVVEEKESKRKKKKKVEVDDDSVPEEGENDHKNNPFKRVFSDADDLVFLKCMVDSINKGIEPTSNIDEFLVSIKKSIDVTFNKEQLINKIRRLKNKYKNSLVKPFTKPHDIKCSKYMKQIWSDDSVVVSNGERSMTVQLYVTNDSTLMGCTSLYKEGLALLGDAKAKELDEKWRKLKTVELENRLKRLDLEREQIVAVLDALKASDS